MKPYMSKKHHNEIEACGWKKVKSHGESFYRYDLPESYIECEIQIFEYEDTELGKPVIRWSGSPRLYFHWFNAINAKIWGTKIFAACIANYHNYFTKDLASNTDFIREQTEHILKWARAIDAENELTKKAIVDERIGYAGDVYGHIDGLVFTKNITQLEKYVVARKNNQKIELHNMVKLDYLEPALNYLKGEVS